MTKRIVRTGSRKRPMVERVGTLEEQVFILHVAVTELSAALQKIALAMAKEAEGKEEKSRLVVP